MTTKEQVKALWKLCFDDSEKFVEMYFRMRYTDNANLAVLNDGKVVSALQMLPYPMTFCGTTVQTSYISGACTHPGFRNRGSMRLLLSQSFARMLHGGVLFSTLIPAEPWLFDYYRRMGYATVFRYATEEVCPAEAAPSEKSTVRIITEYQEEVYSYLNRKLSERPCCLQHTAEDFRVIMADLAVSNGQLFVARQASRITGIAICYQKEQHTVINELLAEDEESEHCLLHAIGQRNSHCRITRLLPPDKELPQPPLGMARIINAPKVLQLYASAFPKDEMRLKLSDEILPQNNGFYLLSGGTCRHSTEPLSGNHTSADIHQLTQRIFQKLHPYMSLMLN